MLRDVTTEVVSRSPSSLIKSIHHDVYVNGTSVGTFTYQFGQKVGLGEVFTCSYVERFTAPTATRWRYTASVTRSGSSRAASHTPAQRLLQSSARVSRTSPPAAS